MVKLRRMSKTRERGPGAPGRSRFLPMIPLGPVALFLRYWKVGIFLLLVLFILYQNTVTFEFLKPIGARTIPGVLQEVEEIENNLQVAREQLIECEASREGLKSAIETTNAQIEQWANLSNKLQQNADNLSSELIDLKKKTTAEVQVILDGPIPQTCEGAVKLLRDAVTNGDLQW